MQLFHPRSRFVTKAIPLLVYAVSLFVAQPATASARTIVVISDLHMGMGPRSRPHPFEDFRWTRDLRGFLKSLPSATPIDLVLNGDTFELWQAPDKACSHSRDDIGCNEAAAVTRVKHVLDAHSEDLVLLRAFANAGENRVHIVPGNHDQALLFPAVRDAVLAAIGARPGRASVVASGVWASADGSVVALHGHQLDDFNRYVPSSFVESDGVMFLRRPLGERFVQDFVNVYEMKYPIVDNVGADWDGVANVYRAEGFVRRRLGAASLVWFLSARLLRTSSRREVLGRDRSTASEWDFAAIRADGPKFILSSLPPDDPVVLAFSNPAGEGQLLADFAELTDDDLRVICDARKLATNRGVPRCPARTLGAVVNAVYQQESRRLQDQLNEVSPRPDVIVVSHTHQPGVSEHVDPDTGFRARLLNTGAWQRTISTGDFAELQARLNLTAGATLRLSPEQLPACYSYVIVERNNRDVAASVRYWSPKRRFGGRHTACGSSSRY